MLTVDLWLWPLAVPPAVLAERAAWLSADERARAARFVRPRDRDAYVAGRGRLRQVLGGYLGVPPQELVFAYNAHGRPALRGGGDLDFNLSHSGGMAALAVCRGAAPGLDIEMPRPIEPAVAERHFSPAELAELAALPPSGWLEGFYRCWTRKEAVLKADGRGLSLPLDSFDVTLGAEARLTRIAGDDAAAWSLVALDPGGGLAGALAVRGTGPLRLVPRTGWPGAA